MTTATSSTTSSRRSGSVSPSDVRSFLLADLDPGPHERPAVRRRDRPDRRQGHAGGARAREPVPGPARRPAALVSLPPPVRRRAARAPARRAARRSSPSCIGGPASGTSRTASGPRRSVTRWPARTSRERRTSSSWRCPAMRQSRQEDDAASMARGAPGRVDPDATGAQQRVRRCAPASGRDRRRRGQAAGRRAMAGRGRSRGGSTGGDGRRRRGSVPRPAGGGSPSYRAGLARMLGDVAGTIAHARRALDLVAATTTTSRMAPPPRSSGSRTGRSGISRQRTAGTPTPWPNLEKAGYLADVDRLRHHPGRHPDRAGPPPRRDAHLRAWAARCPSAEGGPACAGRRTCTSASSELLARAGRPRGSRGTHLRAEPRSWARRTACRRTRYRSRVAMARDPAGGRAISTAALELLAEAERLYVGDFSPDVRPVAALKARVWIAAGKLLGGVGLGARARPRRPTRLDYVREFEHITLARLLVAQGTRDRAGDGSRRRSSSSSACCSGGGRGRRTAA